MRGLLVFLLCAANIVFAQASTSQLNGTVTDPAGAAVPRAQIDIVNGDTGAVLKTTTNDLPTQNSKSAGTSLPRLPERHPIERLASCWQWNVARLEPIDLEHVGNDVDVDSVRQRGRRGRRHGLGVDEKRSE
jgi:hypothetical protein